MNALLFRILAKLWAFNFGHPCPPSKNGEVLLLGQAEPTVVGIAPSPPSIRFSALSLENRQHPCLPSKKGRWLDGKAQTVALLRFNCDTPALFITKPFCRQDGGIVTLTLALHQPFPNPHYPTRFSCCEFDSPTSHKNKIRPRFHGGELIKSLIYKY